jgi:hypothetical protein
MKDSEYSFNYITDFGKYSFVTIDACPIHGPSRPFNFFGYYDTGDMNYLQKHIQEHASSSNHTFLLSHYPVTTMLTGQTSDGQTFGQLARYFSVYMSGHLHKLAGGLGNILHTHHPENYLELEVADMKQHGSFRVFAVDHDLISFSDSHVLDTPSSAFNKPLIVITNPKDIRYFIFKHEELGKIKKSSHIRFLIFSTDRIKTINILINGKAHPEEVTYIGNDDVPLYISKWDPSLFPTEEVQVISISVTTISGQIATQSSRLRLDGKKINLDIGVGEYIMSSRITFWMRRLCIASYFFVTIILLLIPKIISLSLMYTKRYHR